MPYIQADLDNIRAAIATGALRVQIAGRETIFRSLDEMYRIETKISTEISQAANPLTTKSTRIIRPVFL